MDVKILDEGNTRYHCPINGSANHKYNPSPIYLSARPMFMLVYIRMCSSPPSSVTQAPDSSMQVPTSLLSHFFTKGLIASQDAARKINLFSQYFFTKDSPYAMFYPHKPILIYHQTPNTKWMSPSLKLKQPLHHNWRSNCDSFFSGLNSSLRSLQHHCLCPG